MVQKKEEPRQDKEFYEEIRREAKEREEKKRATPSLEERLGMEGGRTK